MRRLSIIAGLILAACGLFLIWMLYGFATMMDPDVQGTAREGAIWSKVASDGMFPVGLLLVVAGGWLMLKKPSHPA